MSHQFIHCNAQVTHCISCSMSPVTINNHKTPYIPIWSTVPFLRLIAGKYNGLISTFNSLSKGWASVKVWSPLALRHSALRIFGTEPSTSRVAGIYIKLQAGDDEAIPIIIVLTFFISKEFNTTPGRPLSCRAVNCDGSWKTNTVITSVAVIIIITHK